MTREETSGRPALFLDRDGVLVEEVNYLGRVDDVRMIAGVADSVAAANRQGIPVVLVTNQAGIARGYYDWSDFNDVQREIYRHLAIAGARLDLVLGCAYHRDGIGALKRDAHPWRKPNSGMILHAGAMLGVDLKSSYLVGDRVSDLLAGQRAGLPGGALVMTGHGRSEIGEFETLRAGWDLDGRFAGRISEEGASAIMWWLDNRQSQGRV